MFVIKKLKIASNVSLQIGFDLMNKSFIQINDCLVEVSVEITVLKEREAVVFTRAACSVLYS